MPGGQGAGLLYETLQRNPVALGIGGFMAGVIVGLVLQESEASDGNLDAARDAVRQ